MRYRGAVSCTLWLVLALWIGMCISAVAHDKHRPELDGWFNRLKSSKGPCCSNNDGTVVADPDWENIDGHYRVKLDGVWYDVPEDAVVAEPNRAGETMVWPLWGVDGLSIRCFLPGALA